MGNELKKLYASLILQNGALVPDKSEINQEIIDQCKALINGHYITFMKNSVISKCIIHNEDVKRITEAFISDSSVSLQSYLEQLVFVVENNINEIYLSGEIKKTYILLFAMLVLQCFLVPNFSGPNLPFENTYDETGFLSLLLTGNEEFNRRLQSESLSLLTISGLSPYNLTESPILLVLALKFFEKLQGVNISLLDSSNVKLESDALVENSFDSDSIKRDDPHSFIAGALCWWRARALQVQQSLLLDVSSELTSLSLLLLCNKTVDSLVDHSTPNSDINQSLLIEYYLERANISIAGELESQTLDAILNANKVSGLSLILTGCKAKMTKYQQKSTATLTVLAKSHDALLRSEQNEQSFNPQDVKLNDDLFLEMPQYDSLGDSELLNQNESEDNEFIKRIKLDFVNMASSERSSPSTKDKLLPTAIKESDVPEQLSNIDCNKQPRLANLDYVQLMLRMQAILNNTPSDNALVNEELIAIIQRILFTTENTVNWLVFSRALWYRSLLETARPRTVERGILQLYSLVEELGVTGDKTARLFPKTEDEIKFSDEFKNFTSIEKPLINSIRLRYVYLIPLMPKWSMDSKLAEKLVELGAFKSALEIYERLEKWTDVALCYASTGDKACSIEYIRKALDDDPNDARSWSVLGDIESNPEYWIKAWEVGRYANSKRSLAKYYYNPPKDSGLTKDLQKAIDNMFECLTANPINFDNWFFYGCMGLEIGNYELAAEAFTRCVSLDDTNSYSWSNLASALIQLDKLSEAFTALQKSVNSGDSAKKSWKIWENYMLVAVKLGKWDDVLYSSIILLNRKKELEHDDSSIDLPVLEKLAELLISEPFDSSKRETYYQKTCTQFICEMVPAVVLHDARIWRIVAKVDLWRNKPWLALEDYEKAYRAVTNNPDLNTDENIWKNATEACTELVSAYENFGELEGRHGAGDVVCKDWKFKAKSTIRSLLSKGKSTWECTDDYEKLQELKAEIMNL